MQNKILIDYDTSVKDISYLLEKKYEEFSKLSIKKFLISEFTKTFNLKKYYFPNIDLKWILNYINFMYFENNFKHLSILLIEVLEKIRNEESTSLVNISNIFFINKHISTVLFINQKILYERIEKIDKIDKNNLHTLNYDSNILQQAILKSERDINNKFIIILDIYKIVKGLKSSTLVKSYEIENSYFSTANILKHVLLINIK